MKIKNQVYPTAEQVGAAAATHASQHASGGSDPITPADIGATPAAIGALPITVTYYSGSSGAVDIADTMLDGAALFPVTRSNNAGLYNALGYRGESYAYVYQFFYSSVTATSNRFQIAHGYANDAMATRHYYSGIGWSDWTAICTSGDTPLTFSITEAGILRVTY